MRMPPLLAAALIAIAAPNGSCDALLGFTDARGVLHLSNLAQDPLDQPLAPLARFTPAAKPLQELIDQTAARFGIDPGLLHALIQVESGYDAEARSAKGAIGLMQLMPQTGRRFGAGRLEDPVDNLNAGTRYLAWLYRRFGGDLPLTLAAYNAGEGAVARFGNRIPPYPETAGYVANVLRRYRAASSNAAASDSARHVVIFSGDAPARAERW
ncbi:MAG: lytic transglycosylase domain-containing protein [Paludibacterium sp.]|uniref:lytic transglycosylase domain-containing protein n=1 Tax=Paludibacterium sp. TaxID=1917523 RepID=UPI0025D99534|nr:lytic transglycosylase domain-containing protein [Paludibacterium sp.]MBV8045821.1 lytic transglycosylase domain-containing protein [Paludibacterium sp.]